MENKDELKKFTEAFFNNLKCNLIWKSDILEVSNVPSAFEEFFGKKAPYFISFDQSMENVELVSKGSFLLKTMIKYLGDRAQTTLIKLDFERDYKNEIEHYFNFRGCEIYRFDKKTNYNSLLRFTFTTTLQYLNEREQLTNDVYVQNNQVIPFIIEKHKYVQGMKNEVPDVDVRIAYVQSKEYLKQLIAPHILETQEILKTKLEKETQRIQEHYTHQRREIEVSVQRLIDQKKNVLKEFPEDSNDLKQKLLRIDEQIVNLRNPNKEKELLDEEQFFIQDELHKLSLGVDNKLMNTAIIYYPIFTFSLTLKNVHAARQLDLTYDPLNDTLTPVQCEACKRELRELMICSSGHVVCSNCDRPCAECGRELCSQCMKRTCDTCARRLCKRCGQQCSQCLQVSCKSHFENTKGRSICQKCARLDALGKR